MCARSAITYGRVIRALAQLCFAWCQCNLSSPRSSSCQRPRCWMLNFTVLRSIRHFNISGLANVLLGVQSRSILRDQCCALLLSLFIARHGCR